MHAHENYKTYGTVEDCIDLEIAEQPLLEQIPPPSIQPTNHRQLGRLLSVASGMYRYVFYRYVSVAWESAVGSLWNVSVCVFIGVCVGCFGDCFEG